MQGIGASTCECSKSLLQGLVKLLFREKWFVSRASLCALLYLSPSSISLFRSSISRTCCRDSRWKRRLVSMSHAVVNIEMRGRRAIDNVISRALFSSFWKFRANLGAFCPCWYSDSRFGSTRGSFQMYDFPLGSLPSNDLLPSSIHFPPQLFQPSTSSINNLFSEASLRLTTSKTTYPPRISPIPSCLAQSSPFFEP